MNGSTSVPVDPPDRDVEWELAIPFVTVASQGGPHDDESYCAGWEMGYLLALLDRTLSQDFPVRRTLRAENVPQADIIAARCDLVQRIVSYAQGPQAASSWCVVEFALASDAGVSR